MDCTFKDGIWALNDVIQTSLPSKKGDIYKKESLFLPPVINPEEMKNCFNLEPFSVQVKEESPIASIESIVTSTSMVKIEPKWDRSEIEQFTGDPLICEWDKPEPILIVQQEGEMLQSNEEYVLNCSKKNSSSLHAYGYKELFPKQTDIPVKIETSETLIEIRISPEIPIKNEEVDLKVEDSEPNIISKSSELRHQEKNDNYKFKCDVCDFQTKRKDSLNSHILRHKNPEEINFFKCDKCDYKTIRKKTLKVHSLRHEKPEEVDLKKFKCHICAFQTKRKDSLKCHLLIHRNPKEVDLFGCDKCDFKTMRKRNLKAHSVRHKNPNEAFFKCDNCEYRTVSKTHLKRHLLFHNNPVELDLFKCDKCAYRSCDKSNLKKHLLRHIDLGEVDLFKCNECKYQTRNKGDLKRHHLRHRNPEDGELFKCDKCPFKTVHKRSFNRHLLRHTEMEIEAR